MNRLRQKYENEVKNQMVEKFGYKSVMQIPTIDKIVINMGIGDAVSNSKVLDEAVAELALITGQKPVITRAKKSIAGFRLRDMYIGHRLRSHLSLGLGVLWHHRNKKAAGFFRSLPPPVFSRPLLPLESISRHQSRSQSACHPRHRYRMCGRITPYHLFLELVPPSRSGFRTNHTSNRKQIHPLFLQQSCSHEGHRHTRRVSPRPTPSSQSADPPHRSSSYIQIHHRQQHHNPLGVHV